MGLHKQGGFGVFGLKRRKESIMCAKDWCVGPYNWGIAPFEFVGRG
jgi:hypothetical protein